jgi:membrane-associated phospholipid phosphatase
VWAEVRALAPPVCVLALVLFSVVATTGLVIVHVFDTTALGRWDTNVERGLAENRTPLLDTLTGAGTWLAETTVVAGLTVLAVAVAAWLTRSWRAPAFLALCVLGEKAIYLAASLVVDRPRPPVVTIGQVYATTSFPSGHVGSAVALYGGVAVLLATQRRTAPGLRWATITLAVVAPVVVGFARMYRGFHYPTDVMAGALLGVLWVAAMWAVILRPADDGVGGDG